MYTYHIQRGLIGSFSRKGCQVLVLVGSHSNVVGFEISKNLGKGVVSLKGNQQVGRTKLYQSWILPVHVHLSK